MTAATLPYDACGNRVLIHHLPRPDSANQLRNSPEQLLALAQTARAQEMDSVMVVSGDPSGVNKQGHHLTMDVFEPNAFSEDSPSGAWSTMCGNGVRAVAQYLHDHFARKEQFLVRTGAGIQRVVRDPTGWRVEMGKFARSSRQLSRYVKYRPRAEEISALAAGQWARPQVGFHYQSDEAGPDGEPHLIIFSEKTSIGAVRSLAQQFGSQLTRRLDWFPQEINTSIASVMSRDRQRRVVSVLAATYERNIYYVTQACGTAATVIGSLVFEKEALGPEWIVEVQMPGGVLRISQTRAGEYALAGPAHALI